MLAGGPNTVGPCQTWLDQRDRYLVGERIEDNERATMSFVLRRRKAKRSSTAATAKKRAYRVEQADPRALEIQAVLEDDLASGARLMQPEYRGHALKHHVLDGYCAAAAAAYFHLEPGDPRAAGLQPMQVNHAHGSHWWISRRDGDEEVIIDLTLCRTDTPEFDYSTGEPKGFTNAGYKKPPPRRAAEIIERVLARRDTQQKR